MYHCLIFIQSDNNLTLVRAHPNELIKWKFILNDSIVIIVLFYLFSIVCCTEEYVQRRLLHVFVFPLLIFDYYCSVLFSIGSCAEECLWCQKFIFVLFLCFLFYSRNYRSLLFSFGCCAKECLGYQKCPKKIYSFFVCL